MKSLFLGAAAALTVLPALAADVAESFERRSHTVATGGTVWRAGPAPEHFEDRPYVRVVPVRREIHVRTRTRVAEEAPARRVRWTK